MKLAILKLVFIATAFAAFAAVAFFPLFHKLSFQRHVDSVDPSTYVQRHFPGEPCWFTFDNRRFYCLQACAILWLNYSELRKMLRDTLWIRKKQKNHLISSSINPCPGSIAVLKVSFCLILSILSGCSYQELALPSSSSGVRLNDCH